MILQADTPKTGTVDAARDLSLIISEFSRTVAKYECEANIPITMWVEIEDRKNDLLRILNVMNDEGVDLPKYDPNNDINDSIWKQNDSKPYTTKYATPDSNKKSSNCNFCNPIKIDFSLKFQKPEIKFGLRWAIDAGNMMFSSNNAIVCTTALTLSQGCIPDLVKIIGMLLMALSTIISSVNMESLSLSGFLSATIGAVLDITLKKGMFMMNISVSKSECLSNMIKEIMSYLPTSQSLNERLDPELLKMFGLYNKNPLDLNKMYDNAASNLEAYGKTGVDKLFDGMDHITSVIDDALARVNDWLEGLFNMSNYLPCEKERSHSKPSQLIENIMNILTMLNTIRAIIDKKYQKKVCGTQDPTDTTIVLTPDDVADIIKTVIDVDTIVKDNKGNTIGIILPGYELKTVYLDTFGCNVPTFMDLLVNAINSPGSTVDHPVTDSTNTTAGKFEMDENAISDGVYSSTPTFSIPSKNYNTITPTVISIDDMPDSIRFSEDFIDISSSMEIVTKLMDRIRNDAIVSQDIITDTTSTVTPVEITPGEPSSDTPETIDDLVKELELLSSSIVTVHTAEGCK